MLLNMALVWLMIVPWGWYMIYLLKCSMIIVLEWYFEITFISRKKGLCWPSFWDYLLFDIRSAQSMKAIYMPLVSKWYMTFISKWAMRSYFHFEMLYDCHFEMRGQNFRTQNCFRQKKPDILLTKMHLLLLFSYTAFYARHCVPILALK